MKQHLPCVLLLLLLLPFLIGTGCRNSNNTTGPHSSSPTVVYLVRHAEKETADPNDQDPNLTEAGQRRANNLLTHLQGVPVDALISTPYRRTRQTLTPLARHHNLEILPYDAHDFAGLAKKINQ